MEKNLLWMKTTDRNLPHCGGWYFIEHYVSETEDDAEVSLVKVRSWEPGTINTKNGKFFKLACDTLDGDSWNFYVSWFLQYTGQNPPPEPRIGFDERYGNDGNT